MSNISALLNPEPGPENPASKTSQAPSRNGSFDSYTATTTHEAADTITTLAAFGSNASYSSSHDHHPQTQYGDAQQQSSLSSVAAPVEPSPPIEQIQFSPTLDQYHHGSKSPEELRRQSLIARSSPAPILAPIQLLSTVLNDQLSEEPQQVTTSFGRDISQIVPPSHSSEANDERVLDGAQDREPAFVRDTSTTTQIRKPSAGLHSTPHPISTAIPLSDPQYSQRSPAPIIKPEPNGTPREGTPSTMALKTERNNSVSEASLDVETLKALEAVKKSDLGLRAKSRETATPAAAPSKKRPAPKSSAATNKKGTAAKKPAAKKRKIDSETASVGGTPSVRRSATPSSRASKTPALNTVAKSQPKKSSQAGTPVAGSSPAPDRSSQAAASDVEDSEGTNEDDDAVFCICRKPDNHRWMIACDGGCEDWFHGSCVNMQQEDENLIDKYICPNCEENGRGFTTWKPMCRRDGCRQPARLIKDGPVSKYCSDQCGVLFFKNAVGRSPKKNVENGATGKRVKRKVNKDAEEDVDMDEGDDEEPSPRGGALRARDLKSLATAVKDIDSFRRLGSGVLSPPATASPTKASFSGSPKINGISHAETNGDVPPTAAILLNPAESEHLAALEREKSDLQSRLVLLKDRETFLSLTRGQAARYAEREKLKPKEVCGYDQRLSWSETEFANWRASKFGKAALKHNTLEPSDEQVAVETDSRAGVGENGKMQGEAWSDETDGTTFFCTKKRCARHTQWQKLNLHDVFFEQAEVKESLQRVEREGKDVRERAMLRARTEAAAKKIERTNARGGEGWIEAVET
ncbi:hypothetical protein K432DRAFT_378813 [Lepidopterella palustris CBS 459.81]|uniref:PHD-type domain-containing protein n=1 Tax=Lepidopterella palustris CBS 459.81 TaxID=1314670 RepID=A0A8E2EHS8_9PEZI|nr:hypothetical protein K432DRAFT_378813 [Lepidopterella palustris CBS 459.81]